MGIVGLLQVSAPAKNSQLELSLPYSSFILPALGLSTGLAQLLSQLDTRQTHFGVSFDGQAAFPSVDREIQIRELYSCGETGDILQYSKCTYENTVSRMKQNGKVSREIVEYKGARQGHKRSSGHFKSYINPCLITADTSQLGFYIGPICVSVICIADDTYVLSGNPRSLQGLVDIIGHYGRRYRLIFGAEKTKVTVTGSTHDMKYYSENNVWTFHDYKLKVSSV